MVEVSAANASKQKKSADHIMESGIWLKSSGRVIKRSPGPPATSWSTIVSGFAVNAKADGKMTTPARIATSMSSVDTWMEVFAKSVLLLKYDPYVIMHPMPRESEKKACPIASRNRVDFTSARSGRKRKLSPLAAPSSVMDRTANTISRRKSKGMNIFAERSIPFFTPETMKKADRKIKAIIHAICLQGLACIVPKCAVRSPARERLPEMD